MGAKPHYPQSQSVSGSNENVESAAAKLWLFWMINGRQAVWLESDQMGLTEVCNRRLSPQENKVKKKTDDSASVRDAS